MRNNTGNGRWVEKKVEVEREGVRREMVGSWEGEMERENPQEMNECKIVF